MKTFLKHLVRVVILIIGIFLMSVGAQKYMEKDRVDKERALQEKRAEWIRECTLRTDTYSEHGCAEIWEDSMKPLQE